MTIKPRNAVRPGLRYGVLVHDSGVQTEADLREAVVLYAALVQDDAAVETGDRGADVEAVGVGIGIDVDELVFPVIEVIAEELGQSTAGVLVGSIALDRGLRAVRENEPALGERLVRV